MRASMKGVRRWEGDVGMVVGRPMGMRRRKTRRKGEKIIRGREARGPLEDERAIPGARLAMGKGSTLVWGDKSVTGEEET